MERDASAAAAAARERTPVPAVHDPAATTRPRLFIVHAPEDAWFVDGFLVRALSLPEDDVLLSSKLEPGAVIVEEIARGALCPITVMVMSPAFLASPWAQFAHQLALQQTIESANDGKVTLIPALLVDCELPLLSRLRAPMDFRNQRREHWEAEVATLRAKLAAPAPALTLPPCPYPGIRPFTTDDAEHFHGRSQEVADLLGRLRDGQRELYVIGPSGSGKSSLVAAGLVPRLRRSPELAGGSFLVRTLRPGADPAAALARALEAPAAELGDAAMPGLGDAVGRLLASQPAHDRLLVIVDQLEELFTLAGAGARAAFLAGLRALRGDARIALVLTLRADFYAALMESALWTDLDGRLSRLDVGPLRGDSLRIAIEAPAAALGVYFEPVLVARLLHDVADAPGALPLLQDVLLELWHQRTRGLLRLAEYEAMSDGPRSGVAVTLARRANGALSDLPPGRRAIAQRVLVRLVQFGDGVTTTRRQQTRAELATAGDAPDDIDAVVRHLADHRLITTGSGDDAAHAARIDLAHEVLLSAWPTLRDWIRSRKQNEQRRRALEAKATEWVHHGRGPSRLLDGDELQEVRGWLDDATARELGVSEAIQAFVARSAAALAAEAAEVELRRRRWRRWVMVALVGLCGAVVAVSLLAVIAGRRSREANEQARVAEAQSHEADKQSREARRQLARNYVAQGQALLLNDRPAQAAPYFLAAREAGADDVALRMLFRWAAQGVPLLRLGHYDWVNSVAWSPDGARLATASGDRTARVWDAVRGRMATPLLVHHAGVNVVVWSPDGTRVATASNDGSARVWDATTGQPVTPPLEHEHDVVNVAWSPNGGRVATACWHPSSASYRVWDAVTGRAVTPPLTPNTRGVYTRRDMMLMKWSPDGTRLATTDSDETVRVWDAATGRLTTSPLPHQGIVQTMAWSPDGTRLATASDDHAARIWDIAIGRPAAPPLPHQSKVKTLAWSPDGSRLATTSEDRTALVWDATTGREAIPPLAHQGQVRWVAWSRDGTRLATASDDQTARVWDAATGQPVTPPLVHQDIVTQVKWGPDLEHVATASRDDTVRVWDATTGQPVTPPLAHRGRVLDWRWSPDGTRLATASDDKTARVWDATSRHAVASPLHRAHVTAVVWSPDGTRLATLSADDNHMQVWNAASGQRLMPNVACEGSGVWSPDKKRIATMGHATMGHAGVEVCDAVSGLELIPPLVHIGTVNAIAWNPNGTRLATASRNDAYVWDAINGQLVTTLSKHTAAVTAVEWSPDGTRVATASADQTAQVWDAVSGRAVAPPLAHEALVREVAWSPDGTRLLTRSDDSHPSFVWDAVSGRLLTRPGNAVVAAEWSPDGTRVATGSRDHTAQVWDAASGQPLTPPLVHQGPVESVAWSPDGIRLATTSRDKTARVWDTTSGQPLPPPLMHQNIVRTAAWSPDGRWLATVTDKAARVWDMSSDTGTLADWRAVVARSDYRLNQASVLVLEEPPEPPVPPLPALPAATRK